MRRYFSFTLTKEEVALWNTDHFVRYLDKEAEALTGTQVEPLGDILTEVLRSGRRVNLKGLRQSA